jgi:hypothetical protein
MTLAELISRLKRATTLEEVIELLEVESQSSGSARGIAMEVVNLAEYRAQRMATHNAQPR